MNVFLQLLEWCVAVAGSITLHGLSLFSACIFALLCCGVFAPIGALRWWSGLAHSSHNSAAIMVETRDTPTVEPSCCIVYLSGIGDISGEYTTTMEQDFLDRLAAALPGAVLVNDVFAFSVTNIGMTDEHVLGKFWLWLHDNEVNRTRLGVLGQLINLRNALQVAVSVDRRYGPIYGRGTASTILRSLLKHGYPYGSGMPITLIGYSGGGQISLGAARYLQATLGVPLQLISVGGVMDSDPGIEAVERITHLFGEKDGVQRIGDVIFPNRWPARSSSLWNRGLQSGKIVRVDMGPMTHHDAACYFDAGSKLPSGESFLDHTVKNVVELITSFNTQAADTRAPTAQAGA